MARPARLPLSRIVLGVVGLLVLLLVLAGLAGGGLNRPGIDGGFQPPKDGSHGGTEEVPRRAA